MLTTTTGLHPTGGQFPEFRFELDQGTATLGSVQIEDDEAVTA
jgi:hypothetical protein